MNSVSYVTGLTLALLSTLCHAEWISDVDKKYAKRQPSLYLQVAKAKSLISDANGQTAMNEQAVLLLGEVLRKDQKFAPAYVQFARVTSNLGHQVNNQFDGTALQSQEDYLRKALALEPNYDYAIALMGYTKMFQGNLDEAEKYYMHAEKLGSKYPYLKAQMAQLSTKRGNYRKAINLATQGYEENKSDPKTAAGIVNELIFAYERLDGDNIEELEKWQAKRRTLAPEVAWYWGDHARFRLYFIGDYEGAIKYGEKALSLMNYGVGRYILAGAYYKKWADLRGNQTRRAETKDAWERAASLSPVTGEMIEEFMGNPLLRPTGEALLAQVNQPKKMAVPSR